MNKPLSAHQSEKERLEKIQSLLKEIEEYEDQRNVAELLIASKSLLLKIIIEKA